MASPIPEGLHTVTPHLVVRGGNAAIEFYKRAFGAKEHYNMPTPDGKVAHAELEIGDSVIFLADEFPGSPSRSPKALKGASVIIHLYVPDVDASFSRAVAAGAKTLMPPMDTAKRKARGRGKRR